MFTQRTKPVDLLSRKPVDHTAQLHKRGIAFARIEVRNLRLDQHQRLEQCLRAGAKIGQKRIPPARALGCDNRPSEMSAMQRREYGIERFIEEKDERARMAEGRSDGFYKQNLQPAGANLLATRTQGIFELEFHF